MLLKQVPEFQQGRDLISTAKDLLIHACAEQVGVQVAPGAEPFGTVQGLLYGLTGPDGVLHRLTNPPDEVAHWRRGASSLATLWSLPERLQECTVPPTAREQGSKRALHNFFVGALCSPARHLYDSLAGRIGLRPRDDLLSQFVRLEQALQSTELGNPLVGPAHGDLNYANITPDPMYRVG